MKLTANQEKMLLSIIDDLKAPTIAQIKALELFLSTSSKKISSEEKDLIELTLNSCNNIQDIIDNFSFISKLKTEKISLNYKYFNFSKMVRKCIKDSDILLKYTKLKLNIITKNNLEICADEAKIKKATEKLLTYTINSAFDNSTINIAHEKNKNGIKFEIISKGIEENNKIIEIFNQNQEYSSKYIELFVAKEIIKAHYGKIIYENLENNINVIGFWLPVD